MHFFKTKKMWQATPSNLQIFVNIIITSYPIKIMYITVYKHLFCIRMWELSTILLD